MDNKKNPPNNDGEDCRCTPLPSYHIVLPYFSVIWVSGNITEIQILMTEITNYSQSGLDYLSLCNMDFSSDSSSRHTFV